MELLCQGQRWMSESEPELGLGVLVEVTQRQVVVWFPGSQVERRYTRQSAPLRRIRFRVGDTVENRDGLSIKIESVEEFEGVLLYQGAEGGFSEVELNDRLSIDSPEERLRLGQWDAVSDALLRQDILRLQSDWLRSPILGLVGGRIERIPHQMYIADAVSNRIQPRVLLADETGLGKTIEACLILHRLLITGRVERCLILLPNVLVHQWFVELLRRFQLVFQIVDQDFCDALSKEEPTVNPFEVGQCVLCSLPWIIQQPERMVQAVEAGWDFLIVDEAHHIREGSASYAFVTTLSEQSAGTLLLTATPEQQGAESHFARLKMLDPARYTDYASFVAQNERAQELAQVLEQILTVSSDTAAAFELPEHIRTRLDEPALHVLQKALLGDPDAQKQTTQELIDRYGPGRVMFRNTRMQIEGFPIRIVHTLPLETPSTAKKTIEKGMETGRLVESDPRLEWLMDFLDMLGSEKVLVMGGSQREIVALEAQIREEVAIDVALFHEGMTLLQRDRQAVWFADPEGAQVMLCSSIGGEGRNFQCARHLIFWTIPENPEILEQHIGRLDRIGQADTIELHVPYLVGSRQEVWVRWYHEGLGAFEQNFSGGFHALQQFKMDLRTLAPSFWLPEDCTDSVQELLEQTYAFRLAFSERREKGRNRLLELSSFDVERAEQLVQQIQSEEENTTTRDVIFRLFDAFGVEIEPFTEETWKLHPGVRLDEHFPWLQGEAMMVTFAREKALEQATYGFVSLDHPMVSGAMELWLGGTRGRCCVASWKDAPETGLWLECTFVVECVAPKMWGVERFLPPTPTRIVVNHVGRDVTDAFPSDVWIDGLKAIRPGRSERVEFCIEEHIPDMLQAAREQHDVHLTRIVESAQHAVYARLQPEIERLMQLRHHNPSITIEDVERWVDERDILLHYIAQARVRLDSLRLVLGGKIKR